VFEVLEASAATFEAAFETSAAAFMAVFAAAVASAAVLSAFGDRERANGGAGDEQRTNESRGHDSLVPLVRLIAPH